jgi:hypothetical protein
MPKCAPPVNPVAVASSMDAYGGQALPKKTSGLSTDLTQQVVRETGLANNWVDYKICAIDQTRSGLLFARRVR